MNAAAARVPWSKVGTWIAMAIAIAVLDQVTKALVQAQLAPGESVRITGFFNLVLVFNTGAAFSFLANASGWQREFFVAVTTAAAVVIVVLLRRHAGERLFSTGLTLILGGALGNLYDRLTLGKVVDFLDIHAFGWHWPAFNVADSAITVGAALLIVDALFAARRTGKT